MSNAFAIETGEIPQDEAPDTSSSSSAGADDSSTWFDPNYPHSTADAPYGYFPLSNGDPDFTRPRKRRPHGSRSGSSTGVSKGFPASDKSARSAAKILAQMNLFIGMGISAFGLRLTAQELVTANEQFEEVAYNALLADPKLCAKILSAGAKSGQTQLMFAYIGLGASITPVAMAEIKERKAMREAEGYDA